MAISSASTRIFKAEDPVMETDLDLMAKVDEYKEEQFQEGEKQLQGEINNWSLLSQVAKPQDHKYINGKLTDLVNKVNSLGGIDLSDPNNVNKIKNLGYNLYGDQKVMNAVMTTKRMNALSQDIYNKTNGKNAKDYDGVYGEYLEHQYGDWLNDGQVGTSFQGPTSLPQGSFDQYQQKLTKALEKLQPDINEAPQGTADALNYYQIGDKFIKKERVQSLINSLTTEQDRSLLNAHAWKGFQGYSDNNILQLQSHNYDSKIADLQQTWNTLQHQKALVKNNWDQSELFTKQMTDVQNSIDGIRRQKASLPQLQDGQSLPKEYRENVQSNLFNEAFQEDMSNAWAYDQKKTELKTNTAAVERVKMNQQAWQFGQNYDLQLKKLGLEERGLELKEKESMLKLYGLFGMGAGLNGPAGGAPLSLVTTLGKDNATIVTDDSVAKADADYIQKANQFYTNGYNYLMGKDANLYGKFLVKDADGNYIPKDANSAAVVNKGLQQAVDLYGGIANMSIKERNGLTLSDDDQRLFEDSKELKEAELYKNQMQDVEEQVFRKAGLPSPYEQNVTIKLKGGKAVTKTYAELKEMIDRKDPLLQTWAARGVTQGKNNKDQEIADAKTRIFKNFSDGFSRAKQEEFRKEKDKIEQKYSGGGVMSKIGEFLGISTGNSVSQAIDVVNNYYDNSKVKDAWEDASKTFNVYGASVNIPKTKGGKVNPVFAPLQNYLADKVRSTNPSEAGAVQNDDIDVTKVYPVYNPKADADNPVKYYAEVVYQKGGGTDKEGKAVKGDKIQTVDVTDEVMREHTSGGGWLASQFPTDNAEVVYGMLLNNKGQTPMDPKDGYSSALQTHSLGLLTHKFQIVSVKTPGTNGVQGYRINVLIPKGKDQNGVPQFQTVPVINFDPIATNNKITTYNFPANFKYATNYMDSWFQSADRAKEFYKLHGIPYNE